MICRVRVEVRVAGVMICRVDGVEGCASVRSSPMYQEIILLPRFNKEEPTELAYIDTLVNLKIRLDSVKRMTQIQNTS